MRTYKTPLGELPSVTTILSLLEKPGLTQWYAKLGAEKAKELLDASKDRGSVVHAYAQARFEGKDGARIRLAAKDSTLAYFRSFDRLYKAWQVGPLLLEKTVYSKDGYAGTLDFVGAERDFLTVVVDWKTSSKIYFTHAMQVSAYAWAARELGLIQDPILPVVIRIRDDGKFPDIKEIAQWETIYKEAFLPLLKVFRASRKPGRWMKKGGLCSKTARSSARPIRKEPSFALPANAQDHGWSLIQELKP